MKEKCGMLKKKLPLLVLAVLVLQPVLDVLSYFLNREGDTILTTLLRFLLLGLVAVAGFLLSENRKWQLLAYGIMAGFWLLHMINCFRIGYQSPFLDTANYLRIITFPVYTLAFLSFLRVGEERVRKTVYLAFGVNLAQVILFTVLPWALGQPVFTYADLELGLMGWFATANAQSAIIIMLVPFSLVWAYRTKRYPVFLLCALLSCLLLFFTGTKLTFFSIFILFSAFAVLFFLEKGGRSWHYVLPLLVLVAACGVFRQYAPVSVRESMSRYAEGVDYASRIENALEETGAETSLSPVPLSQGAEAPASASPQGEAGDREELIKIYTGEKLYGPMLQDMISRFGLDQVLEAYDYTKSPAILSDSRLRKTIYARLVWEEQDMLTKLLGFEYQEMIAGKTVYDLENDFPAVFYFCGYGGFALYLLFLAGVLGAALGGLVLGIRRRKAQWKKSGGSLWKELRGFLSPELGAAGITFLLACAAAQLSGNVLRRPNVTLYFAVAAAMVVELSRHFAQREFVPAEDWNKEGGGRRE